ncbi:MAG: hypothetical protein ACERLG_07395 [Sedimentibacter sp.]
MQEVGIPSQRTYDNLYEDYSNLTSKQKEYVSNYETLSQYRGLDLDTIIKINDSIGNLENGTTKYSDVLEIEDEYNNLSKDEKEYINNFESLEKFKELSDIEKAAVEGVQNIKDSLKDPSSLELTTIKVKNEINGMGFYFVYIEYSATNSFGGRKEYKSCFAISSDFEDKFYPLAILTGVQKYLDSTTTYLEYMKSDEKEQEIDCDKILSNLE